MSRSGFGTDRAYKPHKLRLPLELDVRVKDTGLYMRVEDFRATFEHEGRAGEVFASVPFSAVVVTLKRPDGGWDAYEISNESLVNAVLTHMRDHPPGTLSTENPPCPHRPGQDPTSSTE